MLKHFKSVSDHFRTFYMKGARKKVVSFSGLVGYSSRNKFKIESFKIQN